MNVRWQCGVIAGLLILVGSARADLPGMRFDRMTPLGGSSGATVEVEVVGANLEGVESLLFDHPGLQAKHVKDRKYAITVAPDVPPGTYDVRLVGKLGVSNPRLFSVTRGLTDVAKKDPADAANPQPITLNSAINGTCGGNRVDVYRLTAKKDQRLVVEVQAGKLDSQMDATLSVTTAAGQALASSGGYNGRDPLVDVLIPADGDYLVRVWDLSYRGGYPYRLIVTDRPSVATVFPKVVQVGKESELTVLGRNLGPGSKPSAAREFDLPLDEARIKVTPPAGLLDLGKFAFLEHPTDHSVLPTAATFTVRGFQVQPRFGDVVTSAQPLLLVDTPVTLEAEPNDSAEKAQPITLPAVVAGRFDKPRDVDWYEFETVEAGSYACEVYCERLAGRADPFLLVTDTKGNRVAELDDFGPRMNAFDGHLRDPSGVVNLAAKTKYRVLVQERYSRGGPRYQYVLTINKAEPDFHIAAIHSANPGPAGTTVRAGGAIHLDMIMQQSGGFRDPIVVTAEGLPPGLHAAPTTLHGTQGVFVLWADANAADWTGPIRLIATAKVGDRTLKREVRPYTRVWNEANIGSSRPTRELVVAIRGGAPFGLGFAEERVTIEAGQKATAKVKLQRLDKEFKEKVTLLSVAPGGLQVANGEIAAGSEEGTVTITVPANTAPGEYTLTVLGQAQVPYSKDTKTPKANVLVSLPARPTTVVVTPKK
jgi:hypothetical protein